VALSTFVKKLFHVKQSDDTGELAERAAVVAEARSWIGTRFRWRAAIKDPSGKGGGADCASFIASTYGVAGIFSPDDVAYANSNKGDNGEPISPMANQADLPVPIYLARVLRKADELTAQRVGEIVTPGPGDMVVMKIKKIEWHGGIVTAWPMLVHCYGDSGVREVNAHTHPVWLGQPVRFFTPWRKP
jgi:cell wall-associated NlpC family hydrolase